MTQGSRWSDVVRAYEESIDLLEAARAEYSDAVKKTMDELKEAAETRRAGISLPEGVELGAFERTTDDDGFAQEWLHAVISSGGVQWVVVHAWVSGSYGGPVATLRVGVEIKRPADVLPWERPWLDAQMLSVRTDLSPCNLESLGSGERWTDGWAWMGDVDLGAATSAGAAADLVARSAEAGAALAAVLEASPVRRALNALRALRRKVEKKPLVKGQTLNPEKSELGRWWPGTLLFGITPADLAITVWVAVDPKERTLLYAHGYHDEKLPQIAERMAKRLGVTSAKRGGYPSGVLLDRAALEAASPGDIAARCEEALRAFVELTTKK